MDKLQFPARTKDSGTASEFGRRTILKTAGAGLGATVFLSVAGTAAASSHPVTVDLLAGQDIDVGTVTAQADGDVLTVTYDTSGTDWQLLATHLHVADTVDGLPTNNPGNPQVGHFDYSGEPAPAPDDTAVYTVDIEGMSGDIYIAAHAEVLEFGLDSRYGGVAVVDSRQAWRYDGTDVRSQRSNPDTTLTREFGQDESNFYSLGYGGVLNEDEDGVETFFGDVFDDLRDPSAIKAMEDRVDSAALSDTENNAGWIIIEFDPPIQNVDGVKDLIAVEDTWGLPYPLELAAVFGKAADADPWSFVCLAHNQEPSPIEDIHTTTQCDLGSLSEAKYVLVQDVTDPAWFDGLYPGQSATLDGYDLNVIQGMHLGEDETAWGDGDRFVDRGNWATYFTYD